MCKRLIVAVALILAWLPAGDAVAQRAGAKAAKKVLIIRAIRVEGTRRIEVDTVISYMLIKPGDPYDANRVNSSLKTLFATGLFSDVNIRLQVDILVVRVVEN